MRRVLVIPSWYASAERPQAGSFFKDQASIAKERYDVRIMVPQRKVWGRRAPYRWLRARMGPLLSFFKTEHDEGDLPVHRIEFEIAGRWSPFDERTTAIEAELALDELDKIGWRPELIHCHCAVPAGMLGCRLARLIGAPFVITEHYHTFRNYHSLDEWQAMLKVYARTERIAALSEFQRQMMLMDGVPGDPMVIGEFADEQVFTLASEAAPGEIRLLFIGLALPYKDYDTFFSALNSLRQLSDAAVAVKILCAEPLQQRAEIAAKARQFIDKYQIEVIGAADRETVARLMHWSSMIVSTSISESFGLAVCEALMCGRPVVTTASGGISDFVVDGWNGFIVRIRDAEGVARRIVDVAAGALSGKPADIRAAVVRSYGREAHLAKLSGLYKL